jgi:hypothetical protein
MKSSFRGRFRALREPFGTAGLVVAIVALVAALAGGAYAASGALTGKQKKEVETIAKKYAGKKGATGPAGAAGPTGAAGAKGDAGSTGGKGEAGVAGATGSPGSAGESVEVNAYHGADCAGAEGENGVEVANAEGTGVVCNGSKGNVGPAGPLSTELQPGMSEAGEWSTDRFEGAFPAETTKQTLVAFPFRLPEGENPEIKFRAAESAPTVECPGSVLEPTAKEGFACLYQAKKEENLFLLTSYLNPETSTNGHFSGRSGFLVSVFETEEAEGAGTRMGGTWAVTAKAAS